MRTSLLAASAALLLAAPALAGNGWHQLAPLSPDLGAAKNYAGRAVELSHDWAFVTANGEDLGLRAVQVYRRDGGTFTPVQALPSPNPSNLSFANALQQQGDVLLVADAYYDIEIAENVGAVHVYRLVQGVWEKSQTLFDKVVGTNDRFGHSIAIDGPWIAVGVRQANGQPGHVAVFREVNGSFVHEVDLASAYGPNLGDSVAIHAADDGQSAHVLAGVPSFDASPQVEHSGVVVPFHVAPGQAFGGAGLAPAGQESYDRFGGSLAFDGERLVVGAEGVTANHVDDGAAYVFTVDTNGLLPQFTYVERLTPGSASAGFGMVVDIDPVGGRLIVGAPYAGLSPQNKPGLVFVYQPEIFGNGYDLEETLWHADGEWGDQLGDTAAVSGDWVLGGASYFAESEGAGMLFSLATKQFVTGMAPASVLAVADAYGPTTGPVFSASTPPVAGQTAVVGVAPATPGHVPFFAYGFAPTEVPIFGATLLVANPQVLVRPPVTQFGQVGIGWPVPNDPVLYGGQFYAQVWLLDPFALPDLQLEASNGLRFTIGF